MERNENAVVEGAWSGAFSDSGFPDAVTFTGSGICISEHKTVISTPTHTLAPIYTTKTSRGFFASNSLPALLALSDQSLDTTYPHYDADIMSIMFGIDGYARTIPTASGGRITLHYLENISVEEGCVWSSKRKRWTRGFVDFEDYFGFLATEVSSVADNARSAQRRRKYELLATVSTGYDSPACAVLGRMAGAQSAITISEARSGFTERNDSGLAIGRILGFDDVREMTREQGFRAKRPQSEVEILSTGYGGDDSIWVGAEESLKGRLLLTGYHGDKIWSTDSAHVSTVVKRGDPSGGSLLEFRLNADFLNLPIPFIGCLSHPDIQRISESEEMSPWRLGNAYDRPIPRRIVEGCGVPRDAFGQSKKAVAQPYQDTDAENPPLDDCLSPNVLSAYREFLDSSVARRSALRASWDSFQRRLSKSHNARTLASRMGLERELLLLQWRHRKHISEHNFVTPWAANVLRLRYLEDLPMAR